MADSTDVAQLFVRGARIVAGAISDPAVVEAWDRSSVLEHQLVSSLAGHLARGGVWVVADYLDSSSPPKPINCEGPVEYFVEVLGDASPQDHQAIRDRGAAVASVGHHELARQLNHRLDALEHRLRSLPTSHPIAVAGGRVMRLGDYLRTRIVEQVVHLDDLARSVDKRPWPYPEPGLDLVIGIGAGIVQHQHGPLALVRALYRHGYGEKILPAF